MKSVLISIRPEWVVKIVSGKKTIEVRKTTPNVPFKAYIYMTKKKPYMLTFAGNGKMRVHNGMVIGEFICDKVDEYKFHNGLTKFNSMGLPSGVYGSYLIFADDYKSMCLSYDEVKNYGKGKTLYGWHISQLKIYDKPKELSEFSRPCSYDGLCSTCKRFKANGSSYDICNSAITCPPRSWCYVEELEESKK